MAEILQDGKNRAEAELARRRKQADEQADAVLALFETNAVTAAAADAAASRWILEWRDEASVSSAFADRTNAFARARARRLSRDAAESAAATLNVAKAEAEAVVRACRGTNETALACEERIKTWRSSWRGEIAADDFSRLDGSLSAELAERKNRDAGKEAERKRQDAARQRRLEAVAAAVSAAARVERLYSSAETTIDRADAAYAAWRDEWRLVRDDPSVSDAEKRVVSVRKLRTGSEDGAKVVAECGRYLDNILLVGPEHVKNWRDLVRQAEIALQQAETDGRIAPAQSASVRERIGRCRRWTVGVIDNKTDRSVGFGNRTIGPVTAATVVFTNGYPVGAALTCEGCEPLHVREERFSSRVFTVLPSDLEERVCETKARIPPLPDGVLCFVDGIGRPSGDVSLRRGRHVVRYVRREETRPGVRDYEPKEYAFETRLSEAVEVPAPAGAWSHSVDFEAARKNAEQESAGRRIEATCRKLLTPLPVETRRERLEKVHALLGDWKTPAALAVLGVGTEKTLRAEYDAECGRIRGYVRNGTGLSASVATDGEPVSVPPGETRLVTFERCWPADAHIAVSGYEFVMLPQDSAAFDGTTFVIRPERLVPLPVRVTVPALGNGVTFRVDGQEASAALELRPGSHKVVYSKPDHVAQEIPFTVRVAMPMTLPPPSKWTPTGAFSGLAAALKAFNSGAVDAAKQLSDGIGTVEDPERRRELEDLRRAIELRKRLEKERK